ncbi:EcsC family protein [Bacillus fonticola]|uniref:EcsC family protein n=1 Tax=Bacillus fonticola TaxID=2728853 RepID=UPI001475C6AE|nr:EcsC family protein [Bacillus fonticola]
MNEMDQRAYDELQIWERKLMKRPGMMKRWAKDTQTKMNSYVPQKVHDAITKAMKGMFEGTMAGSYRTTRKFPEATLLSQAEQLAKERLAVYRKTASIEGAGTGAGGILLGLADFPLLLGIKMKWLHECAAIYGYDTKRAEEKQFLLLVFQLAFSSEEHREKTWQRIRAFTKGREPLDWHTLQQEYRDTIDLAKMGQMLPVVGAAVGAVVNYQLLDRLGEYAQYAFRARWFAENNGK